MKCWDGFIRGEWTEKTDVGNFIGLNYTPHEGDEGFLEGPTENTASLWDRVSQLISVETKKGIYDADTSVVSSIISHEPGYIDRDLEKIVGLQTDKPLKRAIMPYGGLRMVQSSLQAYGYELDPVKERIFTRYRKTHNEGVFDTYSDEMKMARNAAIITGLPDAYGRGRIIGDYRRVALYGVDSLIEEKVREKSLTDSMMMTSDLIMEREEMSDQIKSLHELREMALSYGFDISVPASDTKEAVQWTYFAYLAAVKEQNGAAMSLGRVSTFIDIYAERDLKNGKFTEIEIQEIIDHFVMKLRIVRFLRTPEYNDLFSGDPTWITESIGGMSMDGRSLVTKTSFRFLHTLYNLGPAPEPNLTVLWSGDLPMPFKLYCSKVSIEKSSIQYENDDLMRPEFGDDYGIACCVSAMRIGRQMQFFGARANLAKALLYAINGGKDEISGEQVGPESEPVTSEYLEFDEVFEKYLDVLHWLSGLYINTLNIIHYMHDKYAYEKIQMALHDRDIYRTSACGIAGLSVVADSLSAIKHSRVRVIRNEQGLAVDFEVQGEYPAYGNNDDSADMLACDIVERFMKMLSCHKTYRNSEPTLSVLTITSNIVYGRKTGSTPDGRKRGEPFAPGANPMHGRDRKGAVASMASVAKLPYEYSKDGISYTFSIVPQALGNNIEDSCSNLSALLDGYFTEGGQHINVNVFDKETLTDAMNNPEKYPQLTVRVSGYAVNFSKLTRDQQLEVINRTYHERF